MGLNLRGQPVFRRRPVVDSFYGGFSSVHWPGVCDQCFLLGGSDELSVLTPDGTKVVRQLAAAPYLFNTHSAAVRLAANTAPMLAVIGQIEYKRFFQASLHGVLLIFDSSGQQLYAEMFPDMVEAIAAMPTAKNDRDVLLVGGPNQIWEYSLTGK